MNVLNVSVGSGYGGSSLKPLFYKLNAVAVEFERLTFLIGENQLLELEKSECKKLTSAAFVIEMGSCGLIKRFDANAKLGETLGRMWRSE